MNFHPPPFNSVKQLAKKDIRNDSAINDGAFAFQQRQSADDQATADMHSMAFQISFIFLPITISQTEPD